MYLIEFACKEYTLVFQNIILFESTAVIYNGKLVDIGANGVTSNTYVHELLF